MLGRMEIGLGTVVLFVFVYLVARWFEKNAEEQSGRMYDIEKRLGMHDEDED